MLTRKDKLFIIEQEELGWDLINGIVERVGPGDDDWGFTIMPDRTIVMHQGTQEECLVFMAEAYTFVHQIKEAQKKLLVEKYRRMGVDI